MSWITGIFNWFKTLTAGGADPGKITAIQAKVVQACGFLPMAETVGAILAAGNPTVVTVAAIANQICAAVKSVPSGAATPLTLIGEGILPLSQLGTVNGIPVEGVFVR